MKKITISSKPSLLRTRASADAWVAHRQLTAEPLKRITFDVPLSVHQRVKSQCALRTEKMADVLRAILEQHFPEGDAERSEPAGQGIRPQPEM